MSTTLRTPRPRTTPTARSPNTNGTSTATGPTRPTPARPPPTVDFLRDAGRTRRRPASHRQQRRDRRPPPGRVTVENRAPTASFTATPNPVSAEPRSPSTPRPRRSRRHDRQIRMGPRRQRQLRDQHRRDGDDQPTPTRPPANVTVGLRVTDDGGATATTTRAVTVQNRAPSASFTATPEPRPDRHRRSPSTPPASSDPDGTIAKYEWDLDGNGTYETNTGAKPTTTASYADRRATARSACGSPTTTAPRRRRPRPLTVQNRAADRLLHGHAQPGLRPAPPSTFDASRLERPRRHDRQIRMGPRRQRQLRDEHRDDQDDQTRSYTQRRHGQRRPAGSPTTAAPRRRRRVRVDRQKPARRRPPSPRRPNPVNTQRDGQLQRLRLQRPRRHDRQIRMGPRRQREL